VDFDQWVIQRFFAFRNQLYQIIGKMNGKDDLTKRRLTEFVQIIFSAMVKVAD